MNTRRTKQCALAWLDALYIANFILSWPLHWACVQSVPAAIYPMTRLLLPTHGLLVGWIHVASFTWRLLQVPLSFFDKDLPDLPCVTRILVYSTSHLIHIVFCGLQFNSKIIFHFIADMMDKSTSLYVLSHIGDQFCSVMQEERKAITQAGENGNKTSQSLSGTRCIVIL